MIDRRELLALGGLLGLAPAPENGEGAAIGQNSNDSSWRDIAGELQKIRVLVAERQSFGELDGVRKSQFDYLRANGKFPDFIDLGITPWLSIHDWHIRMQQPLVLARDVNGRYTMMLGFTTLVLRPDFVPTVIGIPYEQR